MNVLIRLRAIIWGVFLYAYVLWFSEYWLAETTDLVTWTLIVLGIIECLMPLRRWWKRMIQLLAIVVITGWTLDYQPFWYTPESWEQISLLMQSNMEPLLPYLWFSLLAAIIYLFVIDWANQKRRILFIASGSILAFCIADSFTLIILWPAILILVLCSLSLVILHHFTEFKVRHPNSWESIKEYPGIVTGTIVFVLLAIVLAGIFAPHVRPMLTDPYTAWLTYRGEAVPNFGKNFSNSSTSTPLSSSSGYSRSDEFLGGGFAYDYSEVMTVTTTHPAYMRGETRSLYTGKGWQITEEDIFAESVPVMGGSELETSLEWDISKLETVEIRQIVTFSDEEMIYPVLFSAFAPSRVEQIVGPDQEALSFDPLLWAMKPHELRWDHNRNSSFPHRYSVVSHAPVITEDGLRRAYDDAEWTIDFNSTYLQVPENMPDRVSDLAHEITAEAENPYDAVKAIEQFLSAEFTYTNQPDFSDSASDDFVDSFLFEIQEGYCDYFSTAMVIMVRELGVPARWVKGYTAGMQALTDEFEEMMMIDGILPDGEGDYIVRNADAHSWVEAYFPGWGWIPFEPTPGFYMPVMEEAPSEVQMEEELEESDLSVTEADSGHLGGIDRKLVQLGVVMIILVLIAAIVYGIFQFKRHKLQRMNGARRIIVEFNRFMRYATRKGLRRSHDETVREWMNHAILQRKSLKGELTYLVRVFEQAKYSPEPVSAETVEKALETIRSLRQKLKR